MFILNSIAPIFILIALGYVLQRTKQMPDSFFMGLSNLVFRIALPALLLDKISNFDLSIETVSRTFLLIVVSSLITVIISWLVAIWLKLSSPQKGSFIQGSVHGNTAFIGIPLISFALEKSHPEAVSLAIVVFGPCVILFNTLAVTTLLHHGEQKQASQPAPLFILKGLLKNPAIIACLIGFLIQFNGIKVPLPFARTLEITGQTALALGLLCIGAGLSTNKQKGATTTIALTSSLIKLVVTPLIGLGLALLLDFTATESLVAVFLLGCPTAINSYVMAETMNNDGPLAGRIIVFTTSLCAITFSIILTFVAPS